MHRGTRETTGANNRVDFGRLASSPESTHRSAAAHTGTTERKLRFAYSMSKLDAGDRRRRMFNTWAATGPDDSERVQRASRRRARLLSSGGRALRQPLSRRKPQAPLLAETVVYTGELEVPRDAAADIAARIVCKVAPNVEDHHPGGWEARHFVACWLRQEHEAASGRIDSRSAAGKRCGRFSGVLVSPT